jgi:glycosyltransferase involved in cell wall biosynthesis
VKQSNRLSGTLEVSVVIPCLDEADTVAACVEQAREAFARAGLEGEVVVADNGSSDGSRLLALAAGARVVEVAERGYGSALAAGIDAARGSFVVMGDADASYDFGEVPRFVAKLREGFDLVQGCRLPGGGGTVRPGAMPPSHRWLGNPLFSALARYGFGSPVHDVYCGLRGFRREFQLGLGQRCTGMEFATEMVLRAALFGARIAELPVTLHPDGRRRRAPHLRTLRDGWRTLRLLLLYSPGWLFLLPGLLLVGAGLLGYGLALPGVRLFGIAFDAHTLVVASLALLLGFQSLLFFLVTKAFAVGDGLLPADPRTTKILGRVQLERGLAAGGVAALVGLGLLVVAVLKWQSAGFGDLDYAQTMRWVVPGATLVALGVQVAYSGFLISMVGLERR